MLGHECRLHWTNQGGCVWVCECGEYGTVRPMAPRMKSESGRTARRVNLTESLARTDHGRHLETVRADVVARSDAVLAHYGRIIPLANATLQRRGRWGHP